MSAFRGNPEDICCIAATETWMLIFRRTAACGFGLLHRAKPPFPLARVHIDLGVPPSALLMIYALAAAADVALDGTVRGGGFRRRGRAKQNCLGVRRNAGGTEYHGFSISAPPVPRGDERACPNPRARAARGFFVCVIEVGVFRMSFGSWLEIDQRPEAVPAGGFPNPSGVTSAALVLRTCGASVPKHLETSKGEKNVSSRSICSQAEPRN